MAAGAGLISRNGRGGKGGSGEGRNNGGGKASGGAGSSSGKGMGCKGGNGGEGRITGDGKGSGGDGCKGGGNILVKRKDRGDGEGHVSKGDGGSDGESRVLETYRAGECSKKTTFERKPRSCSQGIYGTKPDSNVKPTVHFTSKTSIEEPAAKRTLGFIAKSNWDENTITQTMAEREPYFNRVIKAFKEYYKYPKDLEDIGDSVVKEHLKRNMKSYINKIKKRLDKEVKPYKDLGYTDEDIDWDLFRPHYFAPRAWCSALRYWNLPVFKKRSDNGKEARKQSEITARSGAIPYIQRRMKMDAEREANGLLPLTDEEFMEYVYNPTEPVVIALKEKIKTVRASLPESNDEIICGDQPPSPKTQWEIQRKKDILVMLKARPPKKGKTLLYPQQTVAQLVGPEEAAKFCTNSQKVEVDIPDEIYMMMSNILDEVKKMVSSLPMQEVAQTVLDEEVRNLATAAFPDPDKGSLQTHYIRTATGLLPHILKNSDKVIEEVAQPKGAHVVDYTGNGECEDEDLQAHYFPL